MEIIIVDPNVKNEAADAFDALGRLNWSNANANANENNQNSAQEGSAAARQQECDALMIQWARAQDAYWSLYHMIDLNSGRLFEHDPTRTQRNHALQASINDQISNINERMDELGCTFVHLGTMGPSASSTPDGLN